MQVLAEDYSFPPEEIDFGAEGVQVCFLKLSVGRGLHDIEPALGIGANLQGRDAQGALEHE